MQLSIDINMSEADRKKWDARYAAGAHSDLEAPCGVLAQHINLAPVGRALDVACGAGRNALFMARRGFAVDAVDISDVGMALGRRVAQQQQLAITWYCMDLLDRPALPAYGYNLILMCHFIAPELLARLPAHLAAGGVLMVEQHLLWSERSDPVAGGLSGPRSERFRVAPGALRTCLQQADPSLQMLAEEEGLVGSAALARVVVRKPESEA